MKLPALSEAAPSNKKKLTNPFLTAQSTHHNHTVLRLGEDFFSSLFESRDTSTKTNLNTTNQPFSDQRHPPSQHAPNTSAANTSMLRPVAKTSGDLQSVQQQHQAEQQKQQQESDRYAALKDLDEIFKSTVIMSESELFYVILISLWQHVCGR